MKQIGTTIDNRYLIVYLTKEEVDFLVKNPILGQNEMILGYEHVSQNDATSSENRNDCGAACVVICARSNGYANLKVDTVARTYMRPNKPMYLYEVQKALSGYSMPSKIKENVTVGDILNNIVLFMKPVIALVSYGELPHNAIAYRGAHYIVVYGYSSDDSVFLYHDPLSDGRTLEISPEQLTKALDSSKFGNKPNQAIFLT